MDQGKVEDYKRDVVSMGTRLGILEHESAMMRETIVSVDGKMSELVNAVTELKVEPRLDVKSVLGIVTSSATLLIMLSGMIIFISNSYNKAEIVQLKTMIEFIAKEKIQ